MSNEALFVRAHGTQQTDLSQESHYSADCISNLRKNDIGLSEKDNDLQNDG